MTFDVSFRLDGTRKMRSTLARIARDYPAAVVGPGLRKIAEYGKERLIRTRRYRNRTGNLRATSGVERSRDVRGRFRPGYDFVSGGRAAPYGVYVNALRGYFDEAVRRTTRAAPSIMAREARRQNRRFRPRGVNR